MENEYKEVLISLMEAISNKQWDEVKKLYEKYKDSIPPLDTNIDWGSKEDFERLRQRKGLHTLVATYCGKDKVKNSIAMLFAQAYPYIAGWYDI